MPNEKRKSIMARYMNEKNVPSEKTVVKTTTNNQSENNQRKKVEKDYTSYVYFHFVIDRTKSMELVYSAIKPKLESLMNLINDKVKIYNGGVQVKWGVSYITKDNPVQALQYTTEIENVKKAITTIPFQGGSSDGYENINGAIEDAIKLLNENADEKEKKILFVVSDSLPHEEELEYDFSEAGPVTAAFCYVYDVSFEPRINTKRGTHTDSEGIYDTVTKSIKKLLREDSEENKEVINIVNKILEAASVTVNMA